MSVENMLKLLRENDYHIDPLGRLVIDHPDLLEAIQGSKGNTYLESFLTDIGCSNSGC